MWKQSFSMCTSTIAWGERFPEGRRNTSWFCKSTLSPCAPQQYLEGSAFWREEETTVLWKHFFSACNSRLSWGECVFGRGGRPKFPCLPSAFLQTSCFNNASWNASRTPTCIPCTLTYAPIPLASLLAFPAPWNTHHYLSHPYLLSLHLEIRTNTSRIPTCFPCTLIGP